MCRSQQTRGQRACCSQRVPAEDLENGVIDALLATYRDLDQFEQALDIAMAQLHDDRPRLQQELATTDAQIRNTTTALDRYLRAFESGGMPDAVCAPRVEELAARRQELTDYRDDVAASLNRAPAVPPRQHLENVAATLRQTLDEGAPAVVKDLLAGLIATIDILPEREARPTFKLPTAPDSTTPEPGPARASHKTGVRMGLQDVEVRGIEPRSKCLSSGSATSVGLGSLSGCRTPKPSASAAVRHAKVSPPARDDSRQVEPGSDARPSTPGE